MNEFLKAIGILAETSLNFYRNLIDAGATLKEATTLTQAFIAANIFENQPKVGEDDHECHRCCSCYFRTQKYRSLSLEQSEAADRVRPSAVL